jgi:hypothetical protein
MGHVRSADERATHRRHLLVLRVLWELVLVGLLQGLELQAAQTETSADALKMGNAVQLEKLMYERLTEVRLLDFVILGIVVIAMLLEAITYFEVDDLRRQVGTLEIEVGK